jgi:cell wall-associated NlpC family hydrolase
MNVKRTKRRWAAALLTTAAVSGGLLGTSANPAIGASPVRSSITTSAATDSAATDAAIAWAKAQQGSSNWDNYCLKFATDAYRNAGVDIRAMAGDNSSALSYWNTYSGAKYTDANPPAGALVFWNADSYNQYGHVAISLGDGTAISSYERSTHGVHIFSIAERNATKPYLGYVVIA